MSQKVHVKSLRTSIWESSSTAIYAEGARMASIWGQVFKCRSILFSMYGKGYVSPSIKLRMVKKPVYHFPFVSMRMHQTNLQISPILGIYPRRRSSLKGSSKK